MHWVTTGLTGVQKIGSQTSNSFGVSERDMLCRDVRAQTSRGTASSRLHNYPGEDLEDIRYNLRVSPGLGLRSVTSIVYVHMLDMKQSLSYGSAARLTVLKICEGSPPVVWKWASTASRCVKRHLSTVLTVSQDARVTRSLIKHDKTASDLQDWQSAIMKSSTGCEVSYQN